MKLFEGLRKERQSGHLFNRAVQAFHGLRYVLDDEDRVTSGLVSVIDDSLQAIRLSSKNGDAYVLLANGLALGSGVLATRRPELARRLLDAAGAAIHAWWSLPHRGYPITKSVQTGEKLREEICESAVSMLAVPPPGVDAYLKDCHDRLWQDMLAGQALQRLVRELQSRPRKTRATARPKKAQAAARPKNVQATTDDIGGNAFAAQDMVLARRLAEANGASPGVASEMAQVAVEAAYTIVAGWPALELGRESHALVADRPELRRIFTELVKRDDAILLMAGVLSCCAAGVSYSDTDPRGAAQLHAAFIRGFVGVPQQARTSRGRCWDPLTRPTRAVGDDGIPAYESIPADPEVSPLLVRMATEHAVPPELTGRLVGEAAVALYRTSQGFCEAQDALLAAWNGPQLQRQKTARAVFSNVVAEVMFAFLSACALGVEFSMRDRQGMQQFVRVLESRRPPP